MLNAIHLTNFKPWRDTGSVKLAPMSVFFGENSSGKTSLLQSLLLLKQTIEAPSQDPLSLGGWSKSFVDLGTAVTLFHRGTDFNTTLTMALEWEKQTDNGYQNLKWTNLFFSVEILFENNALAVKSLKYANADDLNQFLEAIRIAEGKNTGKYDLRSGSNNIDFTMRRNPGHAWPLPKLISCYGFPPELDRDFTNSDAIKEIEYSFTNLIRSVHYIGPLRIWPTRTYTYANVKPESVGDKGAEAVTMLVGEMNSPNYKPKAHLKKNRIRQVGEALKALGVITEFRIEPIGEVGRLYELKVRVTKYSPLVSIVDVGFGVSQVLPIIVESVFAEPGSILLLEQPELHLHPKVQANLATVLFDFAKTRKIQYIIESHSEHFLTRLQLKLAGSKSGEISQVKIYFCEQVRGESTLRLLETDEFGYIKDWPEDFFGNILAERLEMAEARAQRIIENKKQGGV